MKTSFKKPPNSVQNYSQNIKIMQIFKLTDFVLLKTEYFLNFKISFTEFTNSLKFMWDYIQLG